MRTLRYRIELREGEGVDMLFTPHLYSFKGTQGVTFEGDADNPSSIAEAYADVLFCAALNAWILDGREGDFPHRRGDFHEFMTLRPKEFGSAVNFAAEALSGKSLKELAEEAKKEHESSIVEASGSKKKVFSLLIGKLLKNFL